MKFDEIRQLREGTRLRTTAGDVVTLVGTVRSCAIVRFEDGGTREVRAASLHRVADVEPGDAASAAARLQERGDITARRGAFGIVARPVRRR